MVCLALAFTGCSTAPDEADEPEIVDPLRRVMQIITTACGDASRTTGTGILIGGGRVLTAAHVVIGADDVRLRYSNGGALFVSRPVVVDTVRDLAILRPDPDPNPALPPVELVDVTTDDPVVIASVASDVRGERGALLPVTVRRPVVMTVDEVRSSRRVRRSGYELDARIDGGDSGSGMFDDRGRLAAVIFAEPTQRDATAFAVGADEIEAVLSAPEAPYACDPNRSRVMPTSNDPPETAP